MKKSFLYVTMAIIASSCHSKPDYDATGIFEATTVTVSAETNGKILSFDISEGDSVKAGQRVAIIDTTLLVLQYKQLQSRQSSTESSSPDIAAQAASLRSQIAHQQNECERIARLLADGAATQKQSDDADAALRTLRAQLDGLLSTLGKNRSSISDNAVALQYQKEQIGEQIQKSRISAPITGTVLAKYAEACSLAIGQDSFHAGIGRSRCRETGESRSRRFGNSFGREEPAARNSDEFRRQRGRHCKSR